MTVHLDASPFFEDGLCWPFKEKRRFELHFPIYPWKRIVANHLGHALRLVRKRVMQEVTRRPCVSLLPSATSFQFKGDTSLVYILFCNAFSLEGTKTVWHCSCSPVTLWKSSKGDLGKVQSDLWPQCLIWKTLYVCSTGKLKCELHVSNVLILLPLWMMSQSLIESRVAEGSEVGSLNS